MCSSPHFNIESIIGNSDLPNSVILYSERGGNSGKIVFSTRPSSTICFNWISSTLGAASGKRLCISLGRILSLERSSSRIQDFHFDSIRLIVKRRGQSRSTGIFFSYAICSNFSANIVNITHNRSTEKIFHTRIIFRYLTESPYTANFASVKINKTTLKI